MYEAVVDFKRISAGIFPYKEWVSFVSCLAFCTRAHTSRLMLGVAIPDNKKNDDRHNARYFITTIDTIHSI